MNLTFKRIVSLARKRSKKPAEDAKYLQEMLPKFVALVPEDGGVVEKLPDLFMKTSDEPLKQGLVAAFDRRILYESYVLEIGFGSGENLIFNAKNNPHLGYIGCEVFAGGVIKLLEDIQSNDLENIRIWHDDALALITRLPLASLKLVYILHPDPWPKRRHNKRRLINEEFLRLLSTKMMKNGEILMITDHVDYAQHIAEVVKEVQDIFVSKTNDYPPITKTKYRLKADAQGIESQYFCLVNNASPRIL